MACSGFIEPLNLQCWLVNTFAGSLEIFTIIAIIAIAGLAAFFRMSNLVTLSMFALFGVIMSLYLGPIYILIIVVGGFLTFWSLSRIIKT